MSWDDDNDDEDLDLTIECSNCGKLIYEEAVQCPYCGEYVSRSTSLLADKPVWLKVMFGLIVLWLIFMLI